MPEKDEVPLAVDMLAPDPDELDIPRPELPHV